jgi:hypothetical protein
MGQGREAATVRQFMLVVFLVAAAFSGGAFVNGPGLQWAQTKMLRSLGLNNGGEITSVDLTPVAGAEANTDGSSQAKRAPGETPGPLAPVPSIVTEAESSKYDASDRPMSSQSGLKASGNSSGSPRSGPSPSPRSIKRPLVLAKSPVNRPAPLDRDIAPASAISAAQTANSGSDANAAPAILDTLAALLPSPPPSSRPPSSPTRQPVSSPRKSAADGNENWAVLERKMQSLGVSHFTMDGEPGGRVVFSCLIPLAGRQAVTQRFEAEGDDLVQATRAALRRIALWRATQPSSQ